MWTNRKMIMPTVPASNTPISALVLLFDGGATA